MAKGTVLTYFATATDNRDLGNLSRQSRNSSVFEILVEDPAALEAQRVRQYEELRRKLAELLRIQTDAKLANLMVRDLAKTLADALGHALAVRDKQDALKAQTSELVETFAFAGMMQVRQALALLAADEMSQAAAQAGVLAQFGGAGRSARRGARRCWRRRTRSSRRWASCCRRPRRRSPSRPPPSRPAGGSEGGVPGEAQGPLGQAGRVHRGAEEGHRRLAAAGQEAGG